MSSVDTVCEWGRRPGVALEVRGYLSDPDPIRPRELVDESYEEPLISLPDTGTLRRMVDGYGEIKVVVAGEVKVVRPTEPCGAGAPKGTFDDPWPVCEGELPTWATMLTVYDTVEPQRPAGFGWFGGSRPGSPSTYKDDETAAMNVMYHDGEPVVPEQSAVAWHQYPAEWDRPVLDHGMQGGYQPRLAGDTARYERMRALRPVRNWVSVYIHLSDDPFDGSDDVPVMYRCTEFGIASVVFDTGTGERVCVECDSYIVDGECDI